MGGGGGGGCYNAMASYYSQTNPGSCALGPLADSANFCAWPRLKREGYPDCDFASQMHQPSVGLLQQLLQRCRLLWRTLRLCSCYQLRARCKYLLQPAEELRHRQPTLLRRPLAVVYPPAYHRPKPVEFLVPRWQSGLRRTPGSSLPQCL